MQTSNTTSVNISTLYEDHKKEVKAISLSKCNYDDSLAEEALQQSFLALIETIKEGVEIRCPRTYVMSISKNYTISQIRKLSKESLYAEPKEAMGSDNYRGSVEYMYSEHEYEGKLNDALMALKKHNPLWHYLVLSVYIDGRKQVEIANELGISSAAVYSSLNRMREWSKKNLKQVIGI